MTGLQNQLGLSYGSECDAMASWVQMGGSFSMTEMTMGKSDPVTMGLSRFFCDAPSPLSEWQSRVVQEAQGRDQVISSPDAQTQGQLDKTNARLAQHNAQAKDRISQCRLRLHHYLKRPWLPGAARHITALRAKIESLTQSIKAPVPFSQLSRQIAAIAASGRALDDKKAMVEHLRLDAGLTKGEMRELFTKRIAEVTEESYKRLETDARTLGQRPTDPALHLGMPGSIYTPQAFYAQMNQTLATQTATTDLSRLRQQTSFLRGLYPKPKKRGFWGKIKSGFAKVGGAFKTIGGIAGRLGKAVLPLSKIAGALLAPLRKFPLLGRVLTLAQAVMRPGMLAKLGLMISLPGLAAPLSLTGLFSMLKLSRRQG